MKLIKTSCRIDFVVEDDEAENIVKSFGKQSLVRLRDGNYLNPNTIAAICDIPKVAYWGGFKLNEDGKSFFRDGRRIYLEPESFKEIEYLDDTKYSKVKLIEK